MGERDDNVRTSASAQAIDELRRFGVPVQQLPELSAAEGQPEIDVEPENRDAVRLYLFMQSQWRTQAVVAGPQLIVMRLGLDYAAVPGIAAGLGITPDEWTWEALRLMEAEALDLHGQRLRRQLARR